MMQSFKAILLLATVGFLFATCEDSPEGIQSALFDETGVEQPELDLSFTFRTDINQTIAINNRNGVPNWGEEIYFDIVVSNRLEEEVENVFFVIDGVDNQLNVSSWDTENINIGDIPSFGQGAPTRYWCTDCNEPTEIYLGKTRVITSFTGSGTASITLDLRLTFTYQDNFVTQELTHTFTVFP